MLLNAFAGRVEVPTEKDLVLALGAAEVFWKGLVADLKRELKLDAEEWNTYSVKAGWSLRLKLKKRNIVYLSPSDGCFLASFALGDQAIRAARNSELPKGILKIIDEAKRYPEGTAVRIEVHTAKDMDAVKTLAKIRVLAGT